MNSTQNYYNSVSQELKFEGGVLSQDTPVTPSTTICRFPPQSTTICNMSAICPQYVCNMSAICLQYLQYPQPLPIPRNSTNFHCNPNPSMHSIVLILCLFTKQ